MTTIFMGTSNPRKIFILYKINFLKVISMRHIHAWVTDIEFKIIMTKILKLIQCLLHATKWSKHFIFYLWKHWLLIYHLNRWQNTLTDRLNNLSNACPVSQRIKGRGRVANAGSSTPKSRLNCYPRSNNYHTKKLKQKLFKRQSKTCFPYWI